ncbi:hypothetical protein EV197_3404 [Aquimarina brevivitae]|uniref:Uncharacterized protein n=1 Tax=Aquimarina brevivitae TaxID=323412 RepID=A0A4V2F4V2_9FLAO|nr:hypothetical protein EV197_3404 [Aquimarina brevivitae]
MKMNWSKKNSWILGIAALITIIGIVTGWYLFIFVVLPLGLFFNKRK